MNGGTTSWPDSLPYIGCFVAALALRLTDLGAAPLSVGEAAGAWAAFDATADSGRPVLAATPVSAGLFGVQAFSFWLAGAGDGVARLAPALAGALVVLVPWACATSLGRTESLVLAGLLAIDPLLVGYSRLADGAALSAASCWSALLFAGAAGHAQSPPAVRQAFSTAMWVALSLLCISGPSAWDLLPPLLAALLVLRRAKELPGSAGARGAPLAMMALVALATSTSMFAQWQGPVLVSVSLGEWLRGWGSPGHLSFSELWRALLDLEGAFLLAGAAGLAAAFRRSRMSTAEPLFSGTMLTVLLLWTVWALMLTVRPGRTLTAWFPLQVPLLLGACGVMPRVWRFFASRLPSRPRWAVAGLGAAALVVLHLGATSVRIVNGTGNVFRPYADATEPGVRQLTEHVEALLAHDEIRSVDVATGAGPDPVLGWQLRSVRNRRPSPHVAGGEARRRVIVGIAHDESAARRTTAYPLRREHGALRYATVDSGLAVR